MFQLRDAHIRAFASVAQENFEDRGVQHLRASLPKETAPFRDADLRRRIQECIPRAARYGLTSERQVIAFVDSTYLAGERFDTATLWAPPLLSASGITPESKVELMLASAMVARRQKA